MENFPAITLKERKIFRLFQYYDKKYGKIYRVFSTSPFSMLNRIETKSKAKFKPNPKLKLKEKVRQVLRYHYYTYRTEQA
jgi:hypothetical protein